MSEIKKKEETHTKMFERLTNTIMESSKKGMITVPHGYSAQNAIQGAYLVIKELKDKNKKPALDTCTQESIYMSLLKMTVLGLNPLTQQCYFIVYGDKLQCGIEYTANIMIAKRDCGMIGQPVFDVIRNGEEYITGRDDLGRKYLQRHESNFKSKSGEIIGAYCRINLPGGDFVFKDYSLQQIKSAWGQGYGYKEGQGVHSKFGEEMAIKTAINKTIGRVVRSASNMPASFVGTEFDGEAQAIDTDYTEIKKETLKLPDATEKGLPKMDAKVELKPEPVPAKENEQTSLTSSMSDFD